MLIAHLSDLHLSDTSDVAWLDRQLARIAARTPHHLAVTGDLLDRWDPDLLERALDAFGTHGFLQADRLTLLHGNHDLASSGGHPRRNADLWRLALRFWDPPPLVAMRRHRFYGAVAARSSGIAALSPWTKPVPGGGRLAVINTVPVPWRPLRFDGRSVTVQHAIGCVTRDETDWLPSLKGAAPLILLVHHYPLDAPQFSWTPERHTLKPVVARLIGVIREVRVPMAIAAPDRNRFWDAVKAAGVRVILCGHVHRQRFEWKDGVAVGLNGQSGAAWAGRTIAYYELDDSSVQVQLESVQ